MILAVGVVSFSLKIVSHVDVYRLQSSTASTHLKIANNGCYTCFRHSVNAPFCFLARKECSLPGRRAGTSFRYILVGILLVFPLPKVTFMAPQRMKISVLLVVARGHIHYNILSMDMSINMPALRGMSFFRTVNT